MSIPTVNALALVLLREFGENTSDATLISQTEAWIQDVFDEIGIACNWKYQFKVNTLNTVNGTRLYSLTDIVSDEISLRITIEDIPLIKRTRQELTQMGRDLELVEKPLDWYVENYDSTTEKMVFGLWPIPNAVYGLEFFGVLSPVELSSSSKLPFPREFVFLLKDGVRIKFKEDDKDYTGASKIERRYQNSLQQLIARNNSSISVSPKMQIMDIGYNEDRLVRLPPNHFRN